MRTWVWKSAVAGFAGTTVHALFMYFKAQSGLLPSFQPYHSFQIAIGHWIGTSVPAIVPWALTFLNGMTILGFLFGRFHRWLPGKSGAAKGVTFGLIGWMLTGLVFFPLIGLGPFAFDVGAGIGPALLSLAMLLTYSVVLGIVYVALETPSAVKSRNHDVRA